MEQKGTQIFAQAAGKTPPGKDGEQRDKAREAYRHNLPHPGSDAPQRAERIRKSTPPPGAVRAPKPPGKPQS